MNNYKATTYNNQAVRLLREGDYDGAIHYFSAAFQASKEALEQPSADSVDGLSCISLDDYILNVLFSDTPRSPKVDTANGECIFQQAIAIQSLFVKSCSYRSKLLVTTMIVFNMALAFHLRSMKSSNDTSKEYYLRNAAALYEQAYNLHSHGVSDLGATTNFFSMAILNNIGQAFRSMGDSDKANQCFSHLSTLLAIDRHRKDKARDCLLEHVLCFFCTTSHLRSSAENPSTAAAA